jgi:hypothetical protein
MAVGLLSFADDEGCFWTDPVLIRGTLCPFADDLSKIQRALNELVTCHYLQLGQTTDGRDVARIVDFVRSQRVEKPRPSKIAPLALFGIQSATDRGPVSDVPPTPAAHPVHPPIAPHQSPAATVTPAVGVNKTGNPWLVPPPASVNGERLSEAEIAMAIRWRIGAAHKEWYGASPNMPVPDFEQMTAKFLRDGWSAANIVLVVEASWLRAADAAHESGASICCKCAQDLWALAEVSGKEKQLNIWHARRELIEHGDPDFASMFDRAPLEAVVEWWAFELEQRRPKDDTAPAPSPAPVDKAAPPSGSPAASKVNG